MTAVSTILSIAFLPLNLLLYTKYSYEGDVVSALDWPSLFLALAVVISAISLGLYCSYRISSFEFNRRANQVRMGVMMRGACKSGASHKVAPLLFGVAFTDWKRGWSDPDHAIGNHGQQWGF